MTISFKTYEALLKEWIGRWSKQKGELPEIAGEQCCRCNILAMRRPQFGIVFNILNEKAFMKYILISVLLGKLISCSNAINSDPGSTATSADTGKIASPSINTKPGEDVSGCYMKIVGRDTAVLILEQKGNDLIGKMQYDNFEKDGSRGIVKGKEEAQIIKLWYDFQSEGMHSVMEVYFKKDSGRLIRGVGTMDVKTDTTYFTSGVNYSDKEAFNKVDCKLVKGRFE